MCLQMETEMITHNLLDTLYDNNIFPNYTYNDCDNYPKDKYFQEKTYNYDTSLLKKQYIKENEKIYKENDFDDITLKEEYMKLQDQINENNERIKTLSNILNELIKNNSFNTCNMNEIDNIKKLIEEIEYDELSCDQHIGNEIGHDYFDREISINDIETNGCNEEIDEYNSPSNSVIENSSEEKIIVSRDTKQRIKFFYNKFEEFFMDDELFGELVDIVENKLKKRKFDSMNNFDYDNSSPYNNKKSKLYQDDQENVEYQCHEILQNSEYKNSEISDDIISEYVIKDKYISIEEYIEKSKIKRIESYLMDLIYGSIHFYIIEKKKGRATNEYRNYILKYKKWALFIKNIYKSDIRLININSELNEDKFLACSTEFARIICNVFDFDILKSFSDIVDNYMKNSNLQDSEQLIRLIIYYSYKDNLERQKCLDQINSMLQKLSIH